jgi:AcrR family transcriptional regulator
MPKKGRPAGATDNRAAILAAARAHFSERGYAGATLRSIAGAAGVDPALVYHYFGSKDRLFVEVAGMPVVPAEAIEEVTRQGIDGLGERLVSMMIDVWAGPDGNGAPAIAVLRSATENQAAARMLREFITEQILGRIAAVLDLPDPQLRASLTGSQLIGLAFARYVVGVEPLASMPSQQVIDWYAPVLQHYLTAESSSVPVARASGGSRPPASQHAR